MDQNAKKIALRMIPYGLYILTGESRTGEIAAATVNWVTQTAFDPPLVVVGVKTNSGAHSIIKDAGSFALNILGKNQQATAFAFFKPTQTEDNKINGESYRAGSTGSPLLESVPAYLECKLVDTVEKADHSVFIGQVVDAGVNQTPAARADDVTLTLKDLGDNVYYGG